jgi:hypothetical protein
MRFGDLCFWAAILIFPGLGCGESIDRANGSGTPDGGDAEGDEGDGDGSKENGELVDSDDLEEALVGDWRNDDDSETLKFEEDGDHVRENGDSDETEGTWELDDDVLSMRYEWSEEEDDVEVVDTTEDSAPIAIMDDKLYLYVMHRTDGDGDGLDGEWELVMEHYEKSEEDDELDEEYQEKSVLTLTVDEDQFDVEMVSTGADDEGDGPEEFEVKDEGDGEIRQDGNVIYWTAGSEFAMAPRSAGDEEDEEWILGIRLSDDLIACNYWGKEDPEDIAYEKED